MPHNVHIAALFRLCLAVLFCPIALAPSKGRAAEQPAEQLRLLAEHGIEADTASLVAYLRRLLPDKKRQAEIAALVKQLSDVNFAAREAASKKLPSFGEAARPQLEAALTSKDPEVRLRAKKALAQLDSDNQSRRRESLNLAVLAVLKSSRDPEAAPALLAVIPALTDDASRSAACEALWACTTAQHADALFQAINRDTARHDITQNNAAQRAAALVALEVATGAEHVDEIARRLTSEQPLLRLAAARALIDRRPRAAIETLIPLTGSEDPEVAWQADSLLQMQTGQLLELREEQTLQGAWKAWAENHLAAAQLDTILGARRLDLSAGRNQLEEKFARSQAALDSGYGRFQYTADNGGKAKVADGVLRIDGANPEGDQRLFITSQKMIGRDRWPDRLEVTARLAGENGNNYGWHLGISVGRIKTLFHPGVGQGEFRAETTDGHQSIFPNENMGFAVETGVTYEMKIHVTRTDKGADFEITVPDAKSDAVFRRRYHVTSEQLGDFNRIGLERSGRTGADALFDSITIRLGR